ASTDVSSEHEDIMGPFLINLDLCDERIGSGDQEPHNILKFRQKGVNISKREPIQRISHLKGCPPVILKCEEIQRIVYGLDRKKQPLSGQRLGYFQLPRK